MDRIFSNRWVDPASALVIAVSVLLAYSNTFHATFQFDDLPNIVNNSQLRSLDNLWPVLTQTRGVTYATFMLNYAVGGGDVFGFHLVNILIHIVNSVLVYFLLLSTFALMGFCAPRSRMIAVFSALLFALHPVQTQSVTYIVQRMESLSATFYIVSLMLFARASKASAPGRRWGYYALIGFSYVLSFYSKETAITLPAVVLLYDFCFVSRGRVKEIFGRWPLYGLLGALFVVFTVTTIMPMGGFSDLSEESAEAAAVEGVAAPSVGATAVAGLKPAKISAGFSLKSISQKQYLFTQFNVMAYYFALMLAPVNQNLDYDFPVSSSLFEAPKLKEGTALTIPLPPPVVSLVFLLFVAGLGVYFIVRTRKTPWAAPRVAAFFIFWYFIILSPTSSVVPIADVIYEHRLYLPSLGFFTIFVLCVEAAGARLSGAYGAQEEGPAANGPG